MIQKPGIILSESDVPQGFEIRDAVPSMLAELFSVRHPEVGKRAPEFKKLKEQFVAQGAELGSVYVVYPWLKCAIRILPEAQYYELRTARNRHLITVEEQKAFREKTVAVAGLSVGSAILLTLAQAGGPQRMKIADMDVVETTNLNRLRAAAPDLTMPKTEVAARSVWELDPFAELELFENGVDLENVARFVGDPALDLLIDEVESIEFKVRMRLMAREKKIPVVMATDNGNGIILDVERFDLEPERPILHGLLGKEVNPKDFVNLDFRRWVEIAQKIVGTDELEESMRYSISELGKSIPSIPQLGASAAFAGSAVTYAARMILSGKALKSGRYRYTLADLFDNPALA